MFLTPMEIHDKSFEKKFKGYDEDEVDKFLDQIVNDYGDVLDENSDLKNEIDALKKKNADLSAQVEKYDQIKESLNQSLISAQQHADNLQKDAAQEAKEVKEKAQKEAAEIISKAKISAGKYNADVRQQYGTLNSDYDLLRKQVETFRQEIQKKLQEEIDGLDDDTWQYYLDKYYGRSRLYPADGSQPVPVDDDDEEVSELDEEEVAAEDAMLAAQEAEEKDKIDKSGQNEVKSDSGSDDSSSPKIMIGDSANNAVVPVVRDAKESRLRSSDNNGPTIIFPDDDNE